ncbi:hypothetical protein GJV26_06320 [Massilia dura]|uniref:Uncharacterized protein n=1 Tax=Pseudoduganella dura TaxID=321982 RepID=A0A6I3XFQ9_9BURK|nr:hypothetical protein [Pseudoduganella dura]MUI12092.1 hypothetical protein [Pseudoduganella dura]
MIDIWCIERQFVTETLADSLHMCGYPILLVPGKQQRTKKATPVVFLY